MGRMPNIYRQPFGGPLRWQDDVTGVLPEAVKAFIRQQTNRNQALSAEQVEMVRDYCEYYINAPCWQTEGAEESFAQLREKVKHLKTAGEITSWIWVCLKLGIDPL